MDDLRKMVGLWTPTFNWRRWVWKGAMQSTGKALTYLGELEAAQWLPQESVLHYQRLRLIQFLKFANAHVPYYRQLMGESGLAALLASSSFHSLSSIDAIMAGFAKLPCLDKATIRQAQKQLVADDLPKRRWWYDTTGGSTGEPMRFVTDQTHFEWRQAARHLFDAWTGYVIGEPRLVLWGATRDHATWRKSWQSYLIRQIKQEYWVDTFRMTPAQVRGCIATIQQLRPRHVLAYAESIYELARWVERMGVSVPPIQAIMTSASALLPHMRMCLETVFSASVFNRYGSRELGDVACECEAHDGLHISPFSYYVEILDRKGNVVQGGSIGEIVVTALANRAMPLIRYRTGDYGRWSMGVCGCGRTWPRLAVIEGRIQDTLLTDRGEWVSSAAINRLFYDELWVYRYQVVQLARNHLQVDLQLENPLSNLDFSKPVALQPASLDRAMPSVFGGEHLPTSRLARLHNSLRSLFGEDCLVEMRIVSEIAPTASGKYRPVRSLVDVNR